MYIKFNKFLSCRSSLEKSITQKRKNSGLFVEGIWIKIHKEIIGTIRAYYINV